MAGVPGFEPRLPDPESGVLPLHHSPTFYVSHSDGYITMVFMKLQPLFFAEMCLMVNLEIFNKIEFDKSENNI